jgi:hypothetical protein
MSQLQVTGEAKIRDIQGPVVANSGVITALDGAASQYVRGDGTLADFPTSSGGGSSVSYYLNSSVSQGTIGGVAYRELSKEPIIGAGTDIAISANGYVASYLTDANDPDVLSIPGGNFNCEFYFSVNNNTGNPFFYAELYKYDGTTFTLLGSSVGVPEYINQGTIIAPYYFAIPVATAALALTDRLAIRIYVNVDGRTVTLHTENGHLCQVVTTLSKGMVSLNNLTDQSQFLAVGTSGTDFNIVSSGDTHTFNIPSASASNRGLITTASQTIAGSKTFSVTTIQDAGIVLKDGVYPSPSTGYVGFASNGVGITIVRRSGGTSYNNNFQFPLASNDYNFPNATGTIALTSNLSSYVPYTGATASVNLGGNSLSASALSVATNLILNSTFLLKKAGLGTTTPTYVSQFAATTGVGVGYSDGTGGGNFIFPTAAIYDYTFPAITGTLALLEGAQTFSGSKTFSLGISAVGGISFPETVGGSNYGGITGSSSFLQIAAQNGSAILFKSSNNTNAITISTVGKVDFGSTIGNGTYTYTLPSATGTLALTSNLSAYLPLTGGTLTGALNGTSATFSSSVTASSLIKSGGTSSQYLMADGSTSTLTNPVTGTGTTNYLPKFTGASTIGNSLVYDDGTRVFINATTAPALGSPKFFVKMATANSYEGILVASSSNNNVIAIAHTGSIGLITTNYGTGGTNTNLGFGTGGATQMTLDTSGNLGLGVTPSAWGSNVKAIQNIKSFWLSSTSRDVYFGTNAYFDNTNYRYIDSSFATSYGQYDGSHIWNNAPSGTAGNAITFTQAMTLSASGNLLINSTTDDGNKLQVNGSAFIKGGNSLYIGNNNNANYWGIQSAGTGATALTFQYNSGASLLSIASTGAATFSSSVTATGNISGNITKSGSGVENVNFLQFRLFGTNAIGDSLDIKFLNNGGNNIANISAILGGDNVAYGSLAFSIRNYNTDTMVEAMRINNRGNVGIGNTDPSAKLDINGTGGTLAATAAIVLRDGNSGSSRRWSISNGAGGNAVDQIGKLIIGVGVGSISADPMAGTNVMTMTSGGYVQIGNDTNPYVEIANGGSANVLSGIRWVIGSGRVDYGGMEMAASSADNGYIVFKTRNAGSTAERMRINSVGNIIFTSQVYGNTVGTPRTLYIQSDGEIGGVSSLRVSKINIESFNTNWLYELNPVSFNYRKKDEDGNYIDEYHEELYYGLIAEEAELVNKELCTYNNNKLAGIEYSKLVPALLKAVQEQQAQIEELKALINK